MGEVSHLPFKQVLMSMKMAMPKMMEILNMELMDIQ